MSSRFAICSTCHTEPCTCYSSWSTERIEALLNRVFAEVIERGLEVRYEYVTDGHRSRFAGLTIGPRPPTTDAPRASDESGSSPLAPVTRSRGNQR